jgi:hypothetical protein
MSPLHQIHLQLCFLQLQILPSTLRQPPLDQRSHLVEVAEDEETEVVEVEDTQDLEGEATHALLP